MPVIKLLMNSNTFLQILVHLPTGNIFEKDDINEIIVREKENIR